MLPYYTMFITALLLSCCAYSRFLSVKKEFITKLPQSDFIYKFQVFLISTFLILFTGLRYQTGADYGNYAYIYWGRSELWKKNILDLNEPIFSIICKISSIIYDDPITMFLLSALIIISLYLITICKYSSDIITSIVLFVLAGTLIGSMGALRQYLAAAVLFAGHRFMLKQKFWKHLTVVILACLCHSTALFMLPIYFICNKKINYKTLAILFIASFIVFSSFDIFMEIMSFIKEKDQSEYAYMNTQVNILRILITFVPIVIYAMTAKVKNMSKDDNFYIMMTFINAMLYLSTMNSAYLARIGIYTETYIVFSYPILLKRFNAQSRLFVKIVLYLVFLIYFTFQISIPNLSNYQTIFSR